MRLPFVSAASYNWALRVAEGAEKYADHMAELAIRESARVVQLEAKVSELTDIIVDMKKQNFVVDVPITSTPLSVDEADEYAVAEEEARPALLKRKLV